MGIASILIACFALILSLIIFVRDILRYRIKLQMRVSAQIVLWSEGNQSLVVFRLMFVNHSLSGRSVVKTILESPSEVTGTPAVWLFDENYEKVTALLPNSEQTDAFPISEVLTDAVDIPPHQSRCKWAGFLLNLSRIEDISDNQQIPILFLVADVDDNPLAMVQVPMTKHDLKTLGAHIVGENAILSWKKEKY